jgi:uncharacterized repeat protein (TIGR03837 family)
MAISCDIFCTVVDNFGDAAVCWRLARQLAHDRGWQVRLWIDELQPLCGLWPDIDRDLQRQWAEGVEIRHWPAERFPETEAAEVVIEAFACELPASYVEAMTRSNRVWLNLEYLSAEPWVTGYHRMASPHPTQPLTKHFFFPGFVEGTGGLIRERDADFGVRRPSPALTVSLFGYDNPALPALLDTWSASAEPIVCHVAEGMPRRQVETWLGKAFPAEAEARRGSLALRALPFLHQPEYDRLLGACDLNFVRGEDSFVRAQWARRPFVWHIYPQADAAHEAKLKAFLDLYVRDLDTEAAAASRGFFEAWNGIVDIAAAWPRFRAALPRLAAHADSWAEFIARPGNLAENLAEFCLERL